MGLEYHGWGAVSMGIFPSAKCTMDFYKQTTNYSWRTQSGVPRYP